MTDLARVVADRFISGKNRVFLVDSTGNELTYGTVAARAVGAVGALRHAGITRGSRLGLLLPHGAEFAILYFACLLGGITAVPINGALPIKDLAFILPRCGLKALAVAGGDPSLRNTVGEAGFQGIAHLPRLDPDALLSSAPATVPEIEACLTAIDLSALYSIHFTSGTTSLPKGVPHRVGSLLGNAWAFNDTYGIEATCVMLHVMPMAYMAGFLNTLLVPFMAGGRVVLARDFSAQIVPRFWSPIVERSVNTLWVSPSMLAVLNKVDRDARGPAYCAANPLKILSATAPLPMAVRTAFEKKYGAPVIESYGLSELLLITANLGRAGSPPNAVGPAMPGVGIEIRSVDGAELPAGADGEVFVNTPHAALGYLDYESGLPGTPPAAWMDTGDIGHLDERGYLFITGRKKDLIIRGGFNVSPRTLEELLLRQTGVENVAVVGTPHDFYGEEIVAVIQLSPGLSMESLTPHLREMCRVQLGPQMVPDRFVAVATLPTTVTGKVLKGAVRDSLMRPAP